MLGKILKAFRYYVLREPMVMQFGENDFRVCKHSWWKATACLNNPTLNTLHVNSFWYVPRCIEMYAIFDSYVEALDALLIYNERQIKPTYPKKGKFV